MLRKQLGSILLVLLLAGSLFAQTTIPRTVDRLYRIIGVQVEQLTLQAEQIEQLQTELTRVRRDLETAKIELAKLKEPANAK